MAGAAQPKHRSRPNRRTRAGVRMAHDGCGGVACGVQALDHAAVLAKDSRINIGDKPALGSEIAYNDFVGSVGTPIHRS